MLRSIYALPFDFDLAKGPRASYMAPIYVYVIADKYDIASARAYAVAAMPMPKAADAVTRELAATMVKTHYEACVKPRCAMGRKICELLINGCKPVPRPDYKALAANYPAFATDMFLAALDNNGRLW
jgi:hypothetical protein